MSKVLIIVYGVLLTPDGKADGTRIRYIELAKALRRKGHLVTLAQTAASRVAPIAGLTTVSIHDKPIASFVSENDVIITYPNDFLLSLVPECRNKPLVIDLYDPLMATDFLRASRSCASTMINTLAAFRAADAFLIANENQRLYYAGLMQMTGADQERPMITVPFGISSEPIDACRGACIYPEGKHVILWPGEFYPWFDPDSALDAFLEVHNERKDVALAFVGGTHYQKSDDLASEMARLRARADELGLTDSYIFFLDWQPYFSRGSIYDADMVMITSKELFPENIISSRTRLLDAIWAGLPIICTSGDRIADALKSRRAAEVVAPGDVAGLRDAIHKLLDSDNQKMMSALSEMKDELSWDDAIEDLDKFCCSPAVSEKGRSSMLDGLPLELQEKIAQQHFDAEREMLNIGLSYKAAIEETYAEGRRNEELLRKKIEETALSAQEEQRRFFEQLSEINVALQVTKKEGESLASQKNELEQSLSRLKDERDNLADEKSLVELDNQRLEQEKGILQLQVGELEAEKAALQLQVGELENERKQLLERKMSLEKQVLSFEKQVLSLQEECECMSKEVAWRQEALQSIYSSRLYKYFCNHIWKAHNNLVRKGRTEVEQK